MLRIEGLTCQAGLRDQSEMDIVLAAFGQTSSRPALMGSMLQAASVALAGRPVARASLLADGSAARRVINYEPLGDVFIEDRRLVVVTSRWGFLRVWAISADDAGDSLRADCKCLEGIVKSRIDGRRVRGMRFNWSGLGPQAVRDYSPSKSNHSAVLQSRAPEYTDDDVRRARLLSGDLPRRTMLRLAQTGKARRIDTADDLDAQVLDHLIEAGLVRKEFLLTCKKDSHTICSVVDQAELEAVGASGATCHACGRRLSDERTQEILGITSASQQLLDGSRWMTIWITDLLGRCGLSDHSIEWGSRAAEDEIDIATELFGLRLFLELKDREFGLGDAYPFASRLVRYSASRGIVATMDKVAPEAKKFFKEQNARGQTIVCLEGKEAIELGVRRQVEDLSRSAARLVLDYEFQSVRLNIGAVLEPWISSR